MMKIGYHKRVNAKTGWKAKYCWPSLSEKLEWNRHDAKCRLHCCNNIRGRYVVTDVKPYGP